jgi:hypothetical protein
VAGGTVVLVVVVDALVLVDEIVLVDAAGRFVVVGVPGLDPQLARSRAARSEATPGSMTRDRSPRVAVGGTLGEGSTGPTASPSCWGSSTWRAR